jgi:hypothetical protein
VASTKSAAPTPAAARSRPEAALRCLVFNIDFPFGVRPPVGGLAPGKRASGPGT